MILCCREALIDMIPASTVSGRAGFIPHSGGAVFNTAIALGRLGARAGMLTGLSSDFFGQQLKAGYAINATGTKPLQVQFPGPDRIRHRGTIFDHHTHS